MGYISRPVYQAAVNSTSGVFTNKDASSSVTTTTAISTKDVFPERGLCANVTLSLYTIMLAVRGKWQGSTDNSTWVDFVPQNNAANVTMQSGTGSVTAAVIAPDAVLSKEFVRFALYVDGAYTGTASDTYSLSYSYAKNNGFRS
jgi:phage terminase large subunit-like protein